MKKKLNKNQDVSAVMVQIQEQLAVLDSKLDSFMTKSLTELAQALAASKPAPRPQIQAQPARLPQNDFRPQRQMYAVVCFECGKDTELPFKPSGNRPVYCKECFALRKGRPAPVNPAVPATTSVQAPAAAAAKKKAPQKAASKKKPAAKKKTSVKKKVKK